MFVNLNYFFLNSFFISIVFLTILPGELMKLIALLIMIIATSSYARPINVEKNTKEKIIVRMDGRDLLKVNVCKNSRVVLDFSSLGALIFVGQTRFSNVVMDNHEFSVQEFDENPNLLFITPEKNAKSSTLFLTYNQSEILLVKLSAKSCSKNIEPKVVSVRLPAEYYSRKSQDK